MSNYTVVHGDVLEWAKGYEGEKFHALLCDPPYELGFMGKDWDKSGIAFKAEVWEALKACLLPGGFMMAFSGSRRWHRMAVAIEDAGFVMHSSIFGWAFGSGFPKATRVKGDDRFEGHRYGGQAIKPAVEPIIVAQKPYEGKPVECIGKTGAGTLNIDGGRIGYESGGNLASNPSLRESIKGGNGGHIISTETESREGAPHKGGRWPANLILSHLPECKNVGVKKVKANQSSSVGSGEGNDKFFNGLHGYVLPSTADSEGNEIVSAWECVEGCAVLALDRQSGILASGKDRTSTPTASSSGFTGHGQRGPHCNHGDTGTASRFFYQVQTTLDEADPIRYQAKASRKERDAGLNDLHNNHPTVKPLDLCRYLATLLLPPAEYAPCRLLIPFAGVMSEAIGAMLAGWDHVTAIEQSAEYIEVGRKRIAHWVKESEPVESGNCVGAVLPVKMQGPVDQFPIEE